VSDGVRRSAPVADLVARRVTRNQRLFWEFHGGQLSAYAPGLLTVDAQAASAGMTASHNRPPPRRVSRLLDHARF